VVVTRRSGLRWWARSCTALRPRGLGLRSLLGVAGAGREEAKGGRAHVPFSSGDLRKAPVGNARASPASYSRITSPAGWGGRVRRANLQCIFLCSIRVFGRSSSRCLRRMGGAAVAG